MLDSQRLRRQIHANDFLVVSRVDRVVGERRMRPYDEAISLRRSRRFEPFGAARLLVTLRRELCRDQLALFVGEKETIFVSNDKRIPPTSVAGRLQRFPDALAG